MEFPIFTVTNVKMYDILADYSGNVVFKNHMYAVIHYVITEVIALSDESSNFNEALSKYRRCGRLSSLGSACKKISTCEQVAMHGPSSWGV